METEASHGKQEAEYPYEVLGDGGGKAAIDYICNPDKTDGKLLVSSFGCIAGQAGAHFQLIRK